MRTNLASAGKTLLKLVNCSSTGVDEWLGHDGVVESRLHHQMRGSGGPQVGSQVGETGVYGGNQVRKVHGKVYLSMEVATESEVADTKGSTATAEGGEKERLIPDSPLDHM